MSPPPSLPKGVRTAETITVRVTLFSLAAAMQEKAAAVVVDRHDVEQAQHVGAEEPLHPAVRVAEREDELVFRNRDPRPCRSRTRWCNAADHGRDTVRRS